MPGGLNGKELARQLRVHKPGLKVIYVSGYSADIAGGEFKLLPGEVFIQKPFGVDQILAEVRRSLDG
jgi:FixJ family two-component response regulator